MRVRFSGAIEAKPLRDFVGDFFDVGTRDILALLQRLATYSIQTRFLQ
jgi:hypothetical protein